MAALPFALRRALVAALREAPEAVLPQGRTHYGSLIERLARDIEAARAAEPEAPELASFLRRKGGVSDDRGDIAGMDIPGVGRNRVLAEDGRSLDDLARQAQEEGYFPDAAPDERVSTRTFLDTLDAQSRATPAPSPLRELERYGIDPYARPQKLREALLERLRELFGDRLTIDAPFGLLIGAPAGALLAERAQRRPQV